MSFEAKIFALVSVLFVSAVVLPPEICISFCISLVSSIVATVLIDRRDI